MLESDCCMRSGRLARLLGASVCGAEKVITGVFMQYLVCNLRSDTLLLYNDLTCTSVYFYLFFLLTGFFVCLFVCVFSKIERAIL